MRRCQKNVVDDFLSADVETLMVGIKFSDEKKVRDMKWNSWDNNRVFSGNQWLPKVEQQQQIFWNLNGKKMCGAVNLTCRLVWMMDASDLALILVDLFFVLLFFFSPPKPMTGTNGRKCIGNSWNWEAAPYSGAIILRHAAVVVRTVASLRPPITRCWPGQPGTSWMTGNSSISSIFPSLLLLTHPPSLYSFVHESLFRCCLSLFSPFFVSRLFWRMAVPFWNTWDPLFVYTMGGGMMRMRARTLNISFLI